MHRFVPCVVLAALAGSAFAAPPVPPRQMVQAEVSGDQTEWVRSWRADRNDIIDGTPGIDRDPTSVLVKFREDAPEEVIQFLKDLGGASTIQASFGIVPGLQHLAISGDLDETIETLSQFGSWLDIVEYVEADHVYHLHATPNDTFYSLLWGMNNTGQTVNNDRGTANADIDANLAWDVTTGSASFVVGMADSGILGTHEDLAANIWTNPGEVAGNGVDDDGNGYVDDTWGWDFFNNDNNPTDDNGHGSHTAGTVGAVGNNGTGVAGVCWNVKLAGLKIGSASGSVSVSAAVNAVNYCVGKGIKVANHSWGGGSFNQSLSNAISAARTAGHMLVCSAGNGGADGRGDNNNTVPQYPAGYNFDNVISVAALDNDNKLARYSNYGSTSVDIGAPGSTVASCYNSSTTSYAYLSGTSMAAPHVTGAAALVWSVNPTWTYAQVRDKLYSSGKTVTALVGKTVTGKSVNANNAVR
ncbi:MAG: S8 family peptidase [Phycisphaerales bacterium]